MRDSCERSDPNGMGRPTFSANRGPTATPAMLHDGKHSIAFTQLHFYNVVLEQDCRNTRNCPVLINYRLPLLSNSPSGSDLATGLFALMIMKALWSIRASANAGPRGEGLGEKIMLVFRRSSIA